MSSESQRICLADICSDVSYGYTESASAEPVGPKFLRITDIQGGTFDWDRVPYCPASDAEIQKYQLAVGDIVVARTGNSTGENAQVSKHPPPAVFASYLIRFRPDPTRVNPFFVGYQLRSERFRQHVLSVRSGSAQPGANAKQLGAFPVQLISRPLQDCVVETLRALDDRISLLRETNATLEGIAQALFKSWFVDFDPVRAKMEDRVPDGMDEATAALFPDGFEASELGLVPRGWKPERLDDFIELAYGKALKAGDRKPGNVPVYGSGGITGWHDMALVNTHSIVIGRKGTVGSLYWESRPFFPIDTVFYVKSKRPLTYCYYLLQTLGLTEMNTDAAVPGLNRENVYRLLVPKSPLTLLSAFDTIVAPLRESIDRNARQAQTLATLRDTLLPRLISGQLQIPGIYDDGCEKQNE